jgi:hypothetical protein
MLYAVTLLRILEDYYDSAPGPLARTEEDDTVARVYERIGFQRVGTACVAEHADA